MGRSGAITKPRIAIGWVEQSGIDQVFTYGLRLSDHIREDAAVIKVAIEIKRAGVSVIVIIRVSFYRLLG